jgi:hypothetical protein
VRRRRFRKSASICSAILPTNGGHQSQAKYISAGMQSLLERPVCLRPQPAVRIGGDTYPVVSAAGRRDRGAGQLKSERERGDRPASALVGLARLFSRWTVGLPFSIHAKRCDQIPNADVFDRVSISGQCRHFRRVRGRSCHLRARASRRGRQWRFAPARDDDPVADIRASGVTRRGKVTPWYIGGVLSLQVQFDAPAPDSDKHRVSACGFLQTALSMAWLHTISTPILAIAPMSARAPCGKAEGWNASEHAAGPARASKTVTG